MNFADVWGKTLITFQDESTLTVGLLITAFLVFLLGLIFSKWGSQIIARRMKKAQINADTIAALQKISFFFLAVVTTLTALNLLNVPITAFTFISGAVAIGFGFGAQNIINNFISGWILMSERTVRIGDFIEIDDSKGVVERIGNRSTQIRRIDGVHIMVPNSLLMERSLINWTLVDRNIRTGVSVGVAYGSPVHEVRRLLQLVLDENKLILRDPAPAVAFSDFGDSALIFEALFWCDVASERDLRMIRSDVRFRIDEVFRDNHIVIAFPQRDVNLITNSPIQISAQVATAAKADEEIIR